MLKKLFLDLKNGTSYSVDFLLKESVEETLSRKGIFIRKIFSPLLRLVYSTQTEYKIVIHKREKLNKSKTGKIFVINHRQADDIVIGANAVNCSGYIVFGNKYLALDTTNGLGLWGYGMILLDRDNKKNRKNTTEKMKYVLKNGGNIIIYPEGYWNLDDNGEADECHLADGHNSENWLIQDINIGVLKLSQELGCEIVPTILHYDEHKKKKCYVFRGKAFVVDKTDDVFNRKDELIEIMHTMYWSLCEKYSLYKRSDLEIDKPLSEQWSKLKETLRSDCDILTINYYLDLADEKRIGKAKVVKSVTTYKMAFEHLENLKPNKNNAFLFNKRLK